MKRSALSTVWLFTLLAAGAILATAANWLSSGEKELSQSVHVGRGVAASHLSVAALASQDPILVQATARNFNWRFRYYGPDGEIDTGDDILVVDELHLPLGAEVDLRLTSDDYVYTFSSTELQVREIAVPDLTYRLTFRPRSPGRFELQTDPMCGLRQLHDDLMGCVIVESKTQFLSWLENQ